MECWSWPSVYSLWAVIPPALSAKVLVNDKIGQIGLSTDNRNKDSGRRFKKLLFRLDLGFNFHVAYASEVFGNPTGGAKQGVINEGLLELALDGDLKTIAGLDGAKFHVNSFVFHGRGLSLFNLLNFATVSSFEELPTTRLFEAYLEQWRAADHSKLLQTLIT